MIYISEIFGPTIQGEGLRTGRLSYFIRVGLCNLKCSGFGVKYEINGIEKRGCDSYYSVDKEFKDEWLKLNAKQIIKRLKELKIPKNSDVVITGGEPLIYWNNKEFQKLLKYLHKKNHFITIETNGSIKIDISKKYQKKILFSISPKLSNSNEEYNKRINIEALKSLKKRYFKFVVSSKKEIKEIFEILKYFEKESVFLMPLGANKEELDKISKKILSLAIKNGFNYSDRLHIRMWNKKRGK